MTAPESFVSRWARLKNRSGAGHEPEPEAEDSELAATGLSDTEPETAGRKNDELPDQLDPANLPAIETITVDTDIRGFLQSRVPADLTRAALRQAWVSDPAIRDFIGIAENQWDFNDPNAMPGFGALIGSDNVPALLRQALGECEMVAASMPVTVGQAPLSTTRYVAAAVDQSALPGTPDLTSLEAATEVDFVAEEGEPLALHRSHGSALPR